MYELLSFTVGLTNGEARSALPDAPVVTSKQRKAPRVGRTFADVLGWRRFAPIAKES